MSSVALVSSVARVQVTIPAAWLQAHPGPAAETKAQPAGKGSRNCTLPAMAGPLLRGWMRKLTAAPAVAGKADVTVFCAMRTSAPGRTTVSIVAVLSLLSGSATPPAAGATVALLVTLPPLALTVPTTVSAGIGAPTGCGPLRLQVTTPAACAQAHPLPAADTKATDGGRLSVTTMSPEALGPLLLAVRV